MIYLDGGAVMILGLSPSSQPLDLCHMISRFWLFFWGSGFGNSRGKGTCMMFCNIDFIFLVLEMGYQYGARWMPPAPVILGQNANFL